MFILEKEEESSDEETEEGEVEDDHPSDTEVSLACLGCDQVCLDKNPKKKSKPRKILPI